MAESGKLFLIPTFLGKGDTHDVAVSVKKHLYAITEFIVESEKSARAFLKAVQHPEKQDAFVFHLLNEHTLEQADMNLFFKNCIAGKTIGLMSDAGIPCVADPGSRAVLFAHQKGIRVIPLSGPSSIYMALMASGLNGQLFRFNGYLPIDLKKRTETLQILEKEILKTGGSQLFIETPYRNEALLRLIIKTLKPETRLCIALNISQENEWIKTRRIREWRSIQDALPKDPAIFILGT